MTDYLPYFRPLIANSLGVHFIYDLAESRVHYVSEAYERVFGSPADEVNDHLADWLARVHPDDVAYVRERLAAAPEEEVVPDLELRVDRESGGTQWFCLTACRLPAEAGKTYLSGQIQDITRAKETVYNAQKFNMKKNATLEIMSHDLAAPLVLIQQLTDHLAAEAQPNRNPAVQEILNLIEQTCTEGVNLIRDFVDNEFFESSLVELRRERADMVEMLTSVLEEYKRSSYRTHLSFIYEPPAHPVYVEYDVNKLQQVVNNLISNAIKFTPDGGQIRVSLLLRDDRACLQVADSGIGIPQDLQPVLFDKFTKARRIGLRGEKTNGLGMSLIKTIVELHNGRIWLESAEGKGTTFYVELPALST
jgi:two-component system sensor histidine kinase VicK